MDRFAAAVLAVLLLSGRAGAASDEAASLEALQDDIVVAADGSFTETAHTELRATNEAGVMQVSRVSLFYDSEMQSVEILEAHTLKSDGTKIPVDVSTIYEQLPQDNTLAVTSFRVKVLLFPQFSAGDRAVYTVRYKTAKPFFPNAFYFGRSYPRNYSFKNVRVTLTAPTAMKLKLETHDVAFSKADKGDTQVYTWQIANSKAITVTTIPVSPMDREPRLFASSFKTYGELGAAYATQSQAQVAVTDKTKALAAQITAGTSDRREQTRKIYEWVTKQIRYVAIELGRGSFVPHDADAILAKGYGDCKDHDVLLRALLKAAGIAADPILINAENAYTLTEAPTFSQLNHVITFVPEFGLYLDSTAMAAFGVLPLAEYGKPAVRASTVNPGKITMPLLAPGLGEIATTTTATLDDKGVISGTTKVTARGPNAINLRYAALAIQSVGSEAIAKARLLARGYTDPEGSISMDPPMDLTQSYSLTGTFRAKGLSGWLEKSDAHSMPTGLRITGPIGDGLMGPFEPAEKTEDEPTVCVSGHEVEDIAVTLPTGVRPHSLPDDVKVETANITFTAHWSFKDGTLSVHREFTGRITQALCTGAVRKASAEALKKIADKYDPSIHLTRNIEGFDRSLKENPKDVEALIQRGNEHSNKGEYELALKDFAEAIALAPKNAWARNARGATYMYMEKYDLALIEFDSALALSPDYAQALYNRGLIRSQQKELDKALADFDATLLREPDNAEALVDRGRIYAEQRKPDKALSDYNAALALKPGMVRALGNRARVHLMMGKGALALADCNAALKSEPKAVWVLTLRAAASIVMGQRQAAEQDYDAAYALAPKDTELLLARGAYFNSTRQLDRALGDINALIAQTPNNGYAYALRGDTQRALQHLDLALTDYTKAVSLQSDLLAARAARMELLVEIGKTAQARSECQSLIADNPGKGWPYLICSRLKRALGDHKGANQDVDKAVTREPALAHASLVSSVPQEMVDIPVTKLPPYAKAYGEGTRAYEAGDYEDAAAAFERADRLSQNNPSVLPQLCLALSHTSRVSDAAYQCARALQNAPGDEKLIEAHGKALLRQGKNAEALKDFEELIRLNPKVGRYQRLRDEAKLGGKSAR